MLGQPEKDMIALNKATLSNFMQNQETDKIRRLNARDKNMVMAQEKRSQGAVMHRTKTIVRNQKWDNFRARRAVAVDKYIEAKALQGRCEQMIKWCKCFLSLKRLGTYYTEVKVAKTNEAKRHFAIFRL